jgi:5-methyltetrahydropteroyltriglutamate--homocysteine methyltransferase
MCLLLGLVDSKDVLLGVIDVAIDEIETPEQIASVIAQAVGYVPKEKIIARTNCGIAPMQRDLAEKKLNALARGAALARHKSWR